MYLYHYMIQISCIYASRDIVYVDIATEELTWF